MKINPSTAKNQCAARDEDCAPPIRCELEAGHTGQHQWSGSRNAPVLQEVLADGHHSYKDKEEPVLKCFRTGTEAEQPAKKRAVTKDVLQPQPSTQ